MILLLVVPALLCLLALTWLYPLPAAIVWVLALSTSPDAWAGAAQQEAISGAMKAYGLVLVASLALRAGPRRDRYNPAFAFAAMFCTGLFHGFYPGLTLLSSLRSLIGSAAPFLFSFIRLPQNFCAILIKTVQWAPLFAVLFSAALAMAGLGHFYDFELGALRLGATDQPPFLAGFALTGLYAGLMEYCSAPDRSTLPALAMNFLIILLTGARAPLAIACTGIAFFLLLRRQILPLAAAGAALAAGILLSSQLGFLRIIDLTRLGDITSLSHRNIVWPYFESAFGASPWLGWGVGAGKYIIPVTSQINAVLGTNAAHNEYLRLGTEGGAIGLGFLVLLLILWVRRNTAFMPSAPRWMMRMIFIGFAVHSATDNTMIATTSSAFFLWVSCIFAISANPAKPVA